MNKAMKKINVPTYPMIRRCTSIEKLVYRRSQNRPVSDKKIREVCRSVPNLAFPASATEGLSESYFGEKLSRYFPGLIQQQQGFPRMDISEQDFYSLPLPEDEFKFFFRGSSVGGRSIPGYFVPDYVLTHPPSSLRIAVEVDEACLWNDRKPIHHLIWSQECSQPISVDLPKEEVLLRYNHVLIRFSEEQVVRQPERCCKEIAKEISKITGDNSFLKQFDRTSDIQEVKYQVWTTSAIPEKQYDQLRSKRKKFEQLITSKTD